MHIYYKCRRRIFSALTTFLYSLLCVALRAALAGDHLQSYSDIKGIVHRSKKYYFLPNVSWEIFYEMDAFIHPVILRNSGAERLRTRKCIISHSSSLIVLWFVFKDLCFSHLQLPDVFLVLSVHKHEEPFERGKIVENCRFESLSRHKWLEHDPWESGNCLTLSCVSVMTKIGQTI